MYRMDRQLAKGEQAEEILDNFFADRFHIVPATRTQQRQGIDRVFTHRTTGQPFTVEYKTDWTAGRTGNVFIETVSVDASGKPGWAYASQADWLAYFIPGRGLICLIRFDILRQHLPQWRQTCPPAPPIPNRGYNTRGILVPLDEFRRRCQRVFHIPS
jgi:hypothetical protein